MLIARKFFIGCIIFFAIEINIWAQELDQEITNLENFSNVYQLIQDKYIEPKTSSQLIRSAIEGMLKNLDPYSSLLSLQELAKLEMESTGKYIGVGINAQKKGDVFVVTMVFDSSPAAKSGIKPGDVLLQVNGELLRHQSNQDLKHLFSGKIGTSLEIRFYHPGNKEIIIEKKIHKALINVNTVDFVKIDQGIVLLQVHQFLKDTPTEIEGFLQENMDKAIIIDLRDNPGGLLLSAVETAELFVGRGLIVETRDKNNQVIEKYISYRSLTQKPATLLVLINKHTASAAEILAGAIKDRKQGILLGERSFGKGVIQTIYPLENDLFVKITTAQYITPSGTSFNQVGIEPDYLLEDSFDSERFGLKDRIYQKALELARSKMTGN